LLEKIWANNAKNLAKIDALTAENAMLRETSESVMRTNRTLSEALRANMSYKPTPIPQPLNVPKVYYLQPYKQPQYVQQQVAPQLYPAQPYVSTQPAYNLPASQQPIRIVQSIAMTYPQPENAGQIAYPQQGQVGWQGIIQSQTQNPNAIYRL
jgi:hypothetical protein